MGTSIPNLFPNRFRESIFHPLTRLQIPALYIKINAHCNKECLINDHVAILENQIIFQSTYNTLHPKNTLSEKSHKKRKKGKHTYSITVCVLCSFII
jgi:hypothetical protein